MHACMHACHRHAWSVRDNPTKASLPREKCRAPRPCQKGPHRCLKQISEEIACRNLLYQKPHLRLAQGPLGLRSSLPGMRQENIHNILYHILYLTTVPTATIKKPRARPSNGQRSRGRLQLPPHPCQTGPRIECLE